MGNKSFIPNQWVGELLSCWLMVIRRLEQIWPTCWWMPNGWRPPLSTFLCWQLSFNELEEATVPAAWFWFSGSNWPFLLLRSLPLPGTTCRWSYYIMLYINLTSIKKKIEAHHDFLFLAFYLGDRKYSIIRLLKIKSY